MNFLRKTTQFVWIYLFAIKIDLIFVQACSEGSKGCCTDNSRLASQQPLFMATQSPNCCYFTLSMRFWLFFRQTNTLGVYTPHRDVYSARHPGSVAERLKAPVLKTGDPKG
ncbi:hypothetical protein, partial [Escherichia albertii]|uniref:hypothetical protein n=1 Tax=Escherichia albertii TaxID=208962 RepID=UPI001EE66715